jgi:hypothetical protein
VSLLMKTEQRVPHQLMIHLDYHPNGALEIRYSYPFSAPHALSEQVIRLAPGEVPEPLRKELTEIVDWLHARLNVRPVRFPHGELLPGTRDGILTVVVQDQRRSLPVARLYCYEEIRELGSQVERELRMEATDFSSKQLAVWKSVREKIKGMAWAHFQKKMNR